MAVMDKTHNNKYEMMKDLNSEELLDALVSALSTEKAEELVDWIWEQWGMDDDEGE